MKISELITQLEEIRSKYGDLVCQVPALDEPDDGSFPIASVEIEQQGGKEPSVVRITP
jgi:hypothetical protein